MNANTTTTQSVPPWDNLSRQDLAKLYRQIRQALILGQSNAVTDNSNVVGVRLGHDEKRCIEVLAKLNRHRVSDELRKAIRTHLQRHQQSIVRTGGFIYATSDSQNAQRTSDIQEHLGSDSRHRVQHDADDGCAGDCEFDGVFGPDDGSGNDAPPVWDRDCDTEGELEHAD